MYRKPQVVSATLLPYGGDIDGIFPVYTTGTAKYHIAYEV
jgi:hypothetical protein